MKEKVSFSQKVYDYLTLIPPGKVVTYGHIAEKIGCPGGARAVGNALHRNPEPDRYPCYKVVNGQGRLARNFGDGGPAVQKERLERDGVKVHGMKVELSVYGYDD